jgi:Mrp family chromosome partitioning ATPase
MRRGRARLPVLAEIAGPAEGTRAWSLRRGDFEALGAALPQLAGHRVVAVTGEGEEPVVAAVALASAAAASGRRTILVECDLAHPRLTAQVGLDPIPGLHEYLRWEAEPADVLRPVAMTGRESAGMEGQLVCICGGEPASEAEALLGLQSFSHVVEKLRSGYELVLLLAPPVLAEPGACRVVASRADAVIASLAGDPSRELRKAVNRLPAPALGAIAVAS